MAGIEQLELDAQRGEIIARMKSLVEKYRAIARWEDEGGEIPTGVRLTQGQLVEEDIARSS
jgi:hypothetical protein